MKRLLKVFIILYLFIGCATPINETHIKKNDTDVIYIILPSKVINNYKAMPNLFWKDIFIAKLEENEKLYFKVNYIRASSVLDELGFKKGDTIVMLNDKKVSNLQEYMSIIFNYNGKDDIKVGVFRK